jgi:hypothetical protein
MRAAKATISRRHPPQHRTLTRADRLFSVTGFFPYFSMLE